MNALVLAGVFYLSAAVCLLGIGWRCFLWLRAPVPLKIPLTPAPSRVSGVVHRLAREVIGFRSLFDADRGLWLAAWLFHLSLVLLLIGHLGGLVFPEWARNTLGLTADQFLRVAHTTGGAIGVLAAVSLLWLLFRRLAFERPRAVSTFADYFALVLLLLVISTGNQMRYMGSVDIVQAREFAAGLLALRPVGPPNDAVFAAHLLLTCALLIYIPFSKLAHGGGVFLSPTLNQSNNPRARRHVNPWNEGVPRRLRDPHA